MINNDGIVATAIPATARVSITAVPDFDVACAASERTFPAALHKIPQCFVCGPGRNHGDGLRIHVGPVDPADSEWSGTLAAPWVPAAALADGQGEVGAEFVWAALDCPTAYACGSLDGMPPVLLGRQTVSVARRPRAGEHCVVVATQTGHDGRKYFADAVLVGADGQQIAVCNAIWIEVSEAQLLGSA
ncbi:MAG: hypothetical protein HKN35_05755 [Woeseia sp.]|nr:hypothetical protein [Woeseia sp.]NNE60374.1 hypothetical protein [Woeseia sp.]NNL53788.1 hypothetical protein [Woeseia sp.]